MKMLDYTKYENKLKSGPRFYDERIELQKLQKISDLSPAQKLRVQELKEFIESAKKQNELYDAETKRLYNLWKKDLFEEYGVTNNPKVEKAYTLAYDYGHSMGYSSIESYFSEFVELII
jgi:hypothetical protein